MNGDTGYIVCTVLLTHFSIYVCVGCRLYEQISKCSVESMSSFQTLQKCSLVKKVLGELREFSFKRHYVITGKKTNKQTNK